MNQTDDPRNPAAGGSARVLVAGVGNLFLGDDGFGPEVVRRLAAEPLPDGVEVRDYGVGGIHLAYDLLDGVDTLVLVDVEPRGDAAGTVRVVEVDTEGLEEVAPDAHRMDPVSVIGTVRLLGGTPPRMLVVGCEPADVSEGIGLSEPVAAAVEPAVSTVRELVTTDGSKRPHVGATRPSTAAPRSHGGG